MDPASTVSPIVIGGLTNGTEYSVGLRAINAAGQGVASTFTPVTPRTTADVPTGLVATPQNVSALIEFTPGFDGGSTIINYEYQLGSGAWTALDPEVTSSPVTVPGLNNGTEYSIKLRAVTAAGAGAAS